MKNTKREVQDINIVFLLTVLVNLSASLMPIHKWFPSTELRLLFSEFILVAPSAFYMAVAKKKFVPMVRFHRIRKSTALWIFLFTICMEPVLGIINSISMLFVENAVVSTMNNIVSNSPYLFSLFIIAILPAFLEETVYRGIFFNEYRKVTPIGGVILSALLFGLMHGNLNQFSYAFIMGIVFALLIEATDSILSSMLMHFFFNGISVTLMTLLNRLTQWINTSYNQAVASGDTTTAELYGKYKETITALNSTDSTVVDRSALIASIQSLLPTALICLMIAGCLFCVIAKNENRFDHIRAMFGLNKDNTKPEIELDLTETAIDNTTKQSFRNLLTIPLLCGMAIMAILMIAIEFIP